MMGRGVAALLRMLSLGLAFMLIVWSGLAIISGTHFYGSTGIAYSWVMLALGLGILLVSFGHVKILQPPYVYLYAGFFLIMFINAMGWV